MLHNIRDQKRRSSGARQSGFTIIEVMIVLAVAGLIMAIVFLAVPALQRNNRNTQRRNDVANFMGAVNEYITNNNGSLPATSNMTAVNTLWKPSAVTAPTSVLTGAQGAESASTDTVRLVVNARCGSGGASVAGTSNRQFVVLFGVETSGGGVLGQCSES
jgi:prepilin-type N-terminal cleavage/methylation domain-containing protein